VFSASVASSIFLYNELKVMTLPSRFWSQAAKMSPKASNWLCLAMNQLKPSRPVLKQEEEEGASEKLIHSVVLKM